MGVLRAYFDDSGDPSDSDLSACALAGYVGTFESWNFFEPEWREALDRHGAPYFHMNELGHLDGELGKKFGGRENEAARNAFFEDLIKVICNAGLVGFAAVVLKDDLRRFNNERRLRLNAISLCIFACMNEIFCTFKNDLIEMRIDGFDKATSKIEAAVQIAKSHPSGDASEHIDVNVLSGGFSFKNVLPIQAADFLAYEGLKYNAKRDLTLDPPKQRISFRFLTEACDVTGSVWNYELLNELHEVRDGSWPSELRLAAQSS